MYFGKQHSCIIGSKNCIFAHSISDIKEEDQVVLGKKKKAVLFNGLSYWVTVHILSFLKD